MTTLTAFAPAPNVVLANVCEGAPEAAPLIFCGPPASDKITVLATKFAGVPRLLKSSVSVPALTAIVPVKVLTTEPLSTNVPAPSLVNAVPASNELMVAVWLTTLIVGVVPNVNVFAPDNVQLWSVTPASPNFNVLNVCAASKVTVRSAVMLMVLKSAVLPVPSATTPLSHLLVSLQFPDASVFHVPFWASRLMALAVKIRPIVEIVLLIIGLFMFNG